MCEKYELLDLIVISCHVFRVIGFMNATQEWDLIQNLALDWL